MTTTYVSRYAPAPALAGALCFAAICIATVDTAAATGINAGIIIHERKARFNELSNVMRAIRKELDAPDPDFSRIRRHGIGFRTEHEGRGRYLAKIRYVPTSIVGSHRCCRIAWRRRGGKGCPGYPHPVSRRRRDLPELP